MVTVLEKCGITDGVIKRLKKKGIVVPPKVETIKKALISPSEDWWSYVCDQFALPFTEKERQFYIKHPEQFCKDLIKNTTFFVKTVGILYDAYKNTRRLGEEEALAAKLAIIRIFHSCIESTHLKYDRHLEYHDYKESPVGFHWHRLKELCLSAAKNAGVSDPEMWAKEKVLQLISGYGIVKKSTKGKRLAKDAYNEVESNLKEKQIRELQKLIKIFKLFTSAQEKEGSIFYGPIPNKKLNVLETFFEMFDSIKSMIIKKPHFVKMKYRDKLRKMLEIENPILASKKLMHEGEDFFASKVEELYFEELRRWLE